MNVVWSRRANKDVEEFFDYLHERNAAGARRVRQAVRDQVATLADFPERGRIGHQGGTRELVVARTPYIVAYRVDVENEAIIVLRVRHGAQHRPTDLGDLD